MKHVTKSTGTLVLCAALLAVPAAAQSPAASTARVDSIFARFDRRDAPGCAVAATRGGELLHARGYGMADLENDVAIAPNTAFYIASTSKQFAAYAVILLARDGRLSLDDDVRKLVPELHDFAPRYGTPITIRHLLNHTSGLRDYFALLSLGGWPADGPVTERQFLDLVSRQRTLNFTPGTQHLYSNTGYVLLSIIVKRASGQSLRELAAARIFAPLGMASTVVRDDHTMLVKRRAPAYVPMPGGGWRISVPGFDVVGDGGIYSTVEDLARWAGEFDTPRAGDAEALVLAEQRGVLASGDTIAYAAGLMHGRFRDRPTVAHGGAYGGYRAMLLRLPAERLADRIAVAVLCNAGTANATLLAQQVADVYLGAAPAGPRAASSAASSAASTPAPLPDARLAMLAGVYWDEAGESWLRVTSAPGRLTLAAPGPRTQLRHLAGTTFQAPSGTTLAFGEGQVVVTGPGAPPVTYQTVAATPATMAELEAMTGRYTSDEADATVDIHLRGAGLEMSSVRIAPLPLQHVFGSTFAGAPGVVRFVRDGGAVTGLTISSGRSRGVLFTRVRP